MRFESPLLDDRAVISLLVRVMMEEAIDAQRILGEVGQLTIRDIWKTEVWVSHHCVLEAICSCCTLFLNRCHCSPAPRENLGHYHQMQIALMQRFCPLICHYELQILFVCISTLHPSVVSILYFKWSNLSRKSHICRRANLYPCSQKELGWFWVNRIKKGASSPRKAKFNSAALWGTFCPVTVQTLGISLPPSAVLQQLGPGRTPQDTARVQLTQLQPEYSILRLQLPCFHVQIWGVCLLSPEILSASMVYLAKLWAEEGLYWIRAGPEADDHGRV